jgi:uncharacterized Zn finger protein (UPF0148 family)
MFKEKSSKKRISLSDNAKDNSTLDARHHSMLLQLQEGIAERDALMEREIACKDTIAKWKHEIETLHRNNEIESEAYHLAWSKSIHYSNCLREIKSKLSTLFDERKEIEYYENTANILFNYYDLIDNQESLQTTNVEPVVVSTLKGRKKAHPVNQKSILDAFKTAAEPQQLEHAVAVAENVPSKSELVDEYMSIMDTKYIRSIEMPTVCNCQNCQIPLTSILQEGLLVCEKCGFQELVLIEQNRPVYRQTNKESSNQSYKRINHFTEWVNQIQGKESTEIPEEIFEKILHEFKKEKIQDTHKLSYNKMREILKKLKFNKYYEHIYYIIYRLNGISPPNFSPEFEETLRNMFKEIQGPFLKHCPYKRKNFLSYSYVLFKFCQLLEKDEYLKHFSLLKSREKLHVQDQIWRNICTDVHWEFIQSI